MKQSKLLIPTKREFATNAESMSHKQLLRGGYIQQITAGVYAYLPLAQRVINNILSIIRTEMDKIDVVEMSAPIILPAEMWRESGRYSTYGANLFKFKNRHDRDMILGPTHEETMTTIIRDSIKSYKRLPLSLYQIQTKFRDENRPRSGVLRGREFLMKDAYSFTSDEESLDAIYNNMKKAYINIFNKLDLDYRIIIGDSGDMGGGDSREFSAPSDAGEDIIAYSDATEYAANLEMAKDFYERQLNTEKAKILKKISKNRSEPFETSIDQRIQNEKILVKTTIFEADGKLVAVLMQSDYEVNEVKVKNFLNVDNLEIASEEEVFSIIGAHYQHVGPVGLPTHIRILVDEKVADKANFMAGANLDGIYYQNINFGRDVEIDDANISDFRIAHEGDIAVDGKGKLVFAKGIEIGHIFKLGTRYSESLGAQVLDKNGRQINVKMGSYGIGVSRLLAAVAEQHCDQNGIIWPNSIAPWNIHLIPMNYSDDIQKNLTDTIAEKLMDAGYEVLIDDRHERAGVKFNDSDLIGAPVRITIGKNAYKEVVEIKERNALMSIEEPVDNILEIVSGIFSKD